MNAAPQDIVDFWFSRRIRPHWFDSTPGIDGEIAETYGALWAEASKGMLDHWKATPLGCLALVIILDQMPLNMFRGESRSFSTEAAAIAVTRQAISLGFDEQIEGERLSFLYMPLMHSEKIEDQDLSVKQYKKAGLQSNLDFAEHHRQIISRFGRFPHRNAILGRESTEKEVEYLNSKSAFKG
ncbi:MAG: DUF924 domain-containing protein [Gammaproteobacteria bacterium]|nr:DUF924 domain-containing protein [Gammaproteobacteria bacterium]